MSEYYKNYNFKIKKHIGAHMRGYAYVYVCVCMRVRVTMAARDKSMS